MQPAQTNSSCGSKRSSQLLFLPANQNPFATVRWEQIPFKFQFGDWTAHLERLRDMQYRAAIVGPCGSGKSTLLKELEQQLNKQGKSAWLMVLPHEKQEHPSFLKKGLQLSQAGTILLVDGIERLTVPQRWQLWLSTPNGLTFTCHRKPWVSKMWIRCRTDQALMQYVMEQLGIRQEETLNSAQRAFFTCRGNVREALFQLYREQSQRLIS